MLVASTLVFVILFSVLWLIQSLTKSLKLRLSDNSSEDGKVASDIGTKPKTKDVQAKSKNLVMRGWCGEVSLPLAFWVYGVLGYGGLMIAHIVVMKIWTVFFFPVDINDIQLTDPEAFKGLSMKMFRTLGPFIIFSQAMFYWYASVTIWRSANNSAGGFWKYAAKVVVVILMMLLLIHLIGGAVIAFI